MMKVPFFLCAVSIMACTGIVLSSCSSNDPFDPELSLTFTENILLDPAGGRHSVSIDANAEWSAAAGKGADSWLTIETGKSSISLSAPANETGEVLTETVTVRLTGYDLAESFTVTQQPKPEEFRLTVSPDIIRATYQGGDYTIAVNHTGNVDWSYETGTEGGFWIIEKSKSDSEIVLIITENEGLQRSSEVVFKDLNGNAEDAVLEISQAAGPNSGDPLVKGYTLMASMQGSVELLGQDYNAIHNYMREYGFDYSEHPSRSENDHPDGIHCLNVWDETLKQFAFQFFAHAESHVDGDRGTPNDRQRNEMKSRTGDQFYHINGNWDEWQILEWKFKLPKDFRPSGQFCHIHQLKAQEGNNGAPIITLTPRANSNGSNRRMQVIHTGETSATNKGTIVNDIPLEDFEDEWVQVQEEVHYTYNGYYAIKVTRMSDQKVLIDYSIQDIDMWRSGAVNIRSKFGIYRGFNGKYDPDVEGWRPPNGIKDEEIFIGDFKVYEKNTNPDPKAID